MPTVASHPHAPEIRTLPFRADGSFVIAQFTDLHLTDGNPSDQQTIAVMADVLACEKPDLVILTGDIIAGTGTVLTDSAAAWRMAIEPITQHGIPWAAVFGNHDDEGSMSRAELMQLQQRYPGCLSQPGPASLSGVGNYVIDIEATPGQTATRLYLMDSLSYGPPGVSRYDWIKANQIAWFREQARAAAGLTGLVFFHIPVPEYDEAWRAKVCVGNKFEEVCCPKINSGMFCAMLESGNVDGVFVGHDHINDYEGNWHGIRLCYGRAGGYGSYGHDDMPRGARLIRLQKDQPGFTTWLRLADGSSVTHGAIKESA